VAHQANVVPVTPPVSKIDSKRTAVLNARRAGYRGKSNRRLKTTPVLVDAPNTDPEIGHNSPRARPCARQGSPAAISVARISTAFAIGNC
jgi:hypothetical protein